MFYEATVWSIAHGFSVRIHLGVLKTTWLFHVSHKCMETNTTHFYNCCPHTTNLTVWLSKTEVDKVVQQLLFLSIFFVSHKESIFKLPTSTHDCLTNKGKQIIQNCPARSNPIPSLLITNHYPTNLLLIIWFITKH